MQLKPVQDREYCLFGTEHQMLTDKQLIDIASPIMNGNSFNNMEASVEYGRKVLAASNSSMKDYAWRVAAMLRFLRAHDGECLGDHPDWLARIDALLNEQPC